MTKQDPSDLESLDLEALPPLMRDRSFWGMTVTQFFGAFNDNLFKQLILLLSISAVAAAESEDQQGRAMLLFSIPFLLTTGLAGYLSDRLGKRGIIVLCKMAEIVVMAAGGVAFAVYARTGSLTFLYVVLFFMGAQSGFFGPAKYGILPEMLRPTDLPRANGFILMTTFLAIIFGTVVAGVLLEYFPNRLWVASTACVSIAVVGTLSSLFVRKIRPATPELKFELGSLGVPNDMRQLLRNDKPLLAALFVSSMFWLLAGMVPSTVNVLGKVALEIGDKWTSVLTGVIGVGIALGCVLGGLVSGGKIDFRLVRIGSIGMLLCLILLAIPASGDMAKLKNEAGELLRLPGVGEAAQWLGYWGSLPILLLLGAFTGMFAVPLQVFMQSRPPDGKKGRMIAVMNQANWIGIGISGALYGALSMLIEARNWPRSTMFLFVAALTVPIVLFYHPRNEELGT
ncbi:MAG: MFS transporter [Planctomycetes bacterium]|nr:MFS transporter [Planctomycetota bacterium]